MQKRQKKYVLKVARMSKSSENCRMMETKKNYALESAGDKSNVVK